MGKAKDITGQKYGRLTAIKFAYAKNNTHFWHFQCECGNKIIAKKNAVTSGHHKSCGCLQTEKVSKKKQNDYILTDNYAILLVKYHNQILEVIIDNEDFERVKNVGKWHAVSDQTLKEPSFYICNRGSGGHKSRKNIRLHRFIMNCPSNMVIDHINHNTLDNRKENLRICTTFENQQNLRSKTTEQTGVYIRTLRNIWVANITYKGQRIYKEFKTKDEAIKQRKLWEKMFYNKGGGD